MAAVPVHHGGPNSLSVTRGVSNIIATHTGTRHAARATDRTQRGT